MEGKCTVIALVRSSSGPAAMEAAKNEQEADEELHACKVFIEPQPENILSVAYNRPYVCRYKKHEKAADSL